MGYTSRETLIKTNMATLDHAHKAAQLQGNLALHAIGNAVSTAQLLALPPDPEVFGEFLELQQAAWQRLIAMQATWLRNWAEFVAEADHVQGANTVSKLVQREGNLVVRFTQILASQMTDMMQLGETMEVSYRYWVSEKLART